MICGLAKTAIFKIDSTEKENYDLNLLKQLLLYSVRPDYYEPNNWFLMTVALIGHVCGEAVTALSFLICTWSRNS